MSWRGMGFSAKAYYVEERMEISPSCIGKMTELADPPHSSRTEEGYSRNNCMIYIVSSIWKSDLSLDRARREPQKGADFPRMGLL